MHMKFPNSLAQLDISNMPYMLVPLSVSLNTACYVSSE